LNIRLTRLPDINTDQDMTRHGFHDYGRFALTRTGFWFAGSRSSHPADCQVGWYWAISGEELLVSARGAKMDGESLFNERKPVLARLVEELVKRRVIRKPESITLVE